LFIHTAYPKKITSPLLAALMNANKKALAKAGVSEDMLAGKKD